MNHEREPAWSASELLFRVRSYMADDRAELEEDEAFNRLALALFAFQFDNVPIYRCLCESRGIRPGLVEHWSRIPPLPASAFKEHEVSSILEAERSHVFKSSGTTGHVPSRHFHNAASLALYEASVLASFERHLPSAGARFLFLTPPPSLAPNSSLVHMFETVRARFGAPDSAFAGRLEADGTWSLDFDVLGTTISSGQPMNVLGTAFSFVHWLDDLVVKRTRLRLPAGSRLMETGGYKGRSRVVAKTELRRLMTRHLGAPESHIISEYGMCELSSQAYAAADGILRFPPWVRTQIISPETGAVAPEGEVGLLRIFDAANVHSVMAIQTEDLAIRRGNGFELLGRAQAAEARGCSLLAAT